MNSDLTALERECLACVAAQHWPGLDLSNFRVSKREDTGVGRYVAFQGQSSEFLKDGVYEPNGHVIDMEGLEFGLNFAVCVVDRRIDHLELVTCSPGGWDGVERRWRIV